MEIAKNIYVSNEDNKELFKRLGSESVDVILTDPPYKYLKRQKLEVDFDEDEFFANCKRVLKKDGFIILFGRGSSFYRWNTKLDELRFNFKEEIVWDKSYISSPVTPISRQHETISIYSKGKGKLNTARVPYEEMKRNNINGISQDIKRIKSALNNPKSLKSLLSYVETGEVLYDQDKKRGYNTTVQGVVKSKDRAVCALQMIDRGLKEKSIITVQREHYRFNHPTQKPVRLLERLLHLVRKGNDLVVDPFGGSFSTALASYNLGLQCKSCEIDIEYFEKGVEQFQDKTCQTVLC